MQVILSHFVSLDGVVQAPGGPDEDTDGGFAHGGWSLQFFDAKAMGPVMDGLMQRTDAMLFGRRTWEKAAAAWPQRGGDPFADRINMIPKYVATRTLGQNDLDVWNGSTALPGGDLVSSVRELRERDGNGLYVLGSASAAKTLIAHDLVDEYVLLVEPILLGGGKGIFPADANARPLQLVSAAPTGTGVLMCTYRPVRA